MKGARLPLNFQHYPNPMVHLVTAQTISSYKKLMHDPATAKVSQTAFGKDFRGMAQSCNKTGQKGTNAIFVMMHDEIMHTLMAEIKSLTQIQLLITAHRKTTPTAFESQWGVI